MAILGQGQKDGQEEAVEIIIVDLIQIMQAVAPLVESCATLRREAVAQVAFMFLNSRT
jgi:hypothetical protein